MSHSSGPTCLKRKGKKAGEEYSLFFVEKSLGNINCLLAYLLLCRNFIDCSKEHYENKTDNFSKNLTEGNCGWGIRIRGQLQVIIY